MKVSPDQLRKRQEWPLERKIEWALKQIRIWYDYHDGRVYVAYSGGKDSTVLLHLVRSFYPDATAVFCNTGLEFPEILDHVKATPNVTWLRPKMNFKAVLEKYGYPVVSKKVARYVWDLRRPKHVNPNTRKLRLTGITSAGREAPGMKLSNKWRFLVDAPFLISSHCCHVMKKAPMNKYRKESEQERYDGVMAADSRMRGKDYLRYGCNHLDATIPSSHPLSIWTEENVWEYIRMNKLPYSKIYDMGYRRTGCTFCMFGAHLEKEPNRFQRMKRTHPKLWKYCMDKLGLRQVLDYINVPCGDGRKATDASA